MLYSGRVGRILLVIAGILTFSQSVYQNYGYYAHYIGYVTGKESLEEFIIDGWKMMGRGLVRVQKIADYIREHTGEDDRIYYWSGDVQIYYLSDRRCAIDIIWPIYAEATGSYMRIFESTTKYVILGKSSNIPRPDWLYDELMKHYELEAVIEGQEIFRRKD